MIDARNINDLAARIKQLGMGIQSGQIEGTAQNVMHLMHLKEELQKARAMQNSAMANAPKPPTVMNQVASSAVQDADQAQAQSVQDMMKQRALAMQGEMAGTGGLGSFVREPEKKMALGGAVAFAGLNDSYVNPSLYGEDLSIDDATALSALSPEQKRYYASTPNGMEAAVAAGRNIIAARRPKVTDEVKGLDYAIAAPMQPTEKPKRYQNILPTEDITTPKKQYTPSPMPEMQALTKRMFEEKPQGVDIPAYTPTNVAPAAVTAIAQPTLDNQQLGAAPLTGAGSQILNANAQADNRDMASRMQLRAPQTDNVQTKYGTTVPAGGIAQNPAVQQEPAQERKSLADYRKEYMDLAGPNQSLEDLRSELNKRKEETANSKDKSLGMALMQAGLATMAGPSQYALVNVGAGFMKGLEAYNETQKDLEKAKDRQFDLQAKIGAAQRAEDQIGRAHV